MRKGVDRESPRFIHKACLLRCEIPIRGKLGKRIDYGYRYRLPVPVGISELKVWIGWSLNLPAHAAYCQDGAGVGCI